MLLKSFVATGLAAVVAAGSAVLDLTPSNFDDVVLKSGKPTLVEFFAPWCGHCKSLAPVYEELAHNFEHAKDKVQIAKVDADAEKSLGKRFGIQGFPTLKWFDGKSDVPSDYSGGRDLDALSDFITDKTGVRNKKKAAAPTSVKILTDDNFKKTIGDKHVLVAFTAPWCGHCKNLAPTWEDLATTYANEPDVVIAKVDAEHEGSKATAQAYGVTSFPTLKFFPKGSTEAQDYDGGRTEANFVEYLNIKTGTHRVAGGGLDDEAGLVDVLDEVVSKYVAGTPLADAAAEAKKAAEGLKDKAGDYYVRVFDKLSKNEGYVTKELARLEGIIGKGGLVATKLDELTKKVNVLNKFADKFDGKDEL
ncbi:thioredoxin-like protein [Cercophora newfieldiana]|uniref:protein disulfide-isomerase n=1 Tax=Cercophora newfieldiana TaxID=92897 RepID=A0AA39XR61_9PEZI|nr:thioredoxin-like protein [Cercophora newfieldiana]